MLTGCECPAREGTVAGVLFPEYDALFECFVWLPVASGVSGKPAGTGRGAGSGGPPKAVNHWPGFGPATGRWRPIVHSGAELQKLCESGAFLAKNP